MDAVDYILDGLEAALELERELGVRSVACDRALLTVPERAARLPEPVVAKPVVAKPVAAEPVREERATAQAVPNVGAAVASGMLDFVFLHDRPLSAKGIEMMAKIIIALGKTAETAPILFAPPFPRAKVYVVLGGLALKKHFPGMAGSPGKWGKSPDGADVLVTYSPEYILRFGEVTDAVKKIKFDMWTSLKAVVQRCRA